MRKLVKFAMPLMLSACCMNKPPAPANPVRQCPVPELPEAPAVGFPCSDAPDEQRVCMGPADVVAWARWVARVIEIEAALVGCNLVRRT